MTKTKTRGPRDWFRIEAKADGESSADVYIYDEIGESWWGGGIGPKALVDEISALDVDTLTVHINSPGGSAWDGVTIMNALRSHRAHVDVIVDGLAASAASVIAMSGDTITMNRGSQMMIHDASGGAYGNAEFLEETAAILHKLSNSYADIYAARAGGTREQWRAIMQAETWYTAEEAVDAGLADKWDGTEEDDLEATSAFDLSRFRFKGRAHAPTPVFAATTAVEKNPASTESGKPNTKEVTMSDAFLAGVRERLGLTDAEASEEAVMTALEEALTAPAPTKVLPEGAIVVDETAYAQLQDDAAAGRKAMDTIDAQRRDSIIADALKSGRITAESKDKWRAQLDNDEEGITAIIASMPKNTVPVEEIGHSDSLTSADDALYAKYSGEEA
ncbi:peptidase [Actinomycetaceae bacterium WB03_NA08]|uniref:ATP-dependent Clp protease proteolytic subunit n=1 Tax=Scrofimicrobium canadense TaxID=2652290 RepID=A0A6N7W6S8_9ACTO|nr:head maturation protease, ClpP-related [Scrofimicrobium canadense]MSS84975.1 peptidase [Scrofimicrobium canadense]